MNYEDRVTKEYVENAIAGAGVKLVTGTYAGNNAATRFIDLGFTPKAVLVFTDSGLSATYLSSFPIVYGGLALPDHPSATGGAVVLALSTNGFTVYNNSAVDYVRSNRSGITYYYIAIC